MDDALFATALLFITTTTEIFANDRIAFYDVMSTALQLTVVCMHAAPIIMLRLLLPQGQLYVAGCAWMGWSLCCRRGKLSGRTWSGAILAIEIAVLLVLPTTSHRMLCALHLLQGMIVGGFWVAMCFASHLPNFSFLPLDRHLYRGWRHMLHDAEARSHLVHNVIGHGVLQAAFAVALAPHITHAQGSTQALLDCLLLLAAYAVTALLAAAMIPPHVIVYTGLDAASGVCMPSVPRHCRAGLQKLRGACARELRFYRAYHTNRTNWLLHVVAVPIEWASWLVLLAVVSRSWRLHWALQAGVALVTLAGLHALVSAAAQLLLALAADSVVDAMGPFYALAAAAVAWTASWALQVGVGHWMIEQNQPGMATALTPLSIVISVPMAWQPCIGYERRAQGGRAEGIPKAERRDRKASPRRRTSPGPAKGPILEGAGSRPRRSMHGRSASGDRRG